MRIVGGPFTRGLTLALAVAGCGAKKSSQSFRAGMELICSAGEQPAVARRNPAERAQAMSEWIRTEVTNAEARAAFGAVADASPGERARALMAAARRAGLERCALATATGAMSLDLAEAPPSAVLAEVPDGATLAITADALVLEGTAVVAVRDGEVDPADVDGGAGGNRIPKLTALAAALAKHAPGPLAIAVAPTTPFRVLWQALYSVKGSHRSLALLVRSHGQVKAVTLTLPDETTTDVDALLVPGAAPQPRPLKMAMVITRDRTMLLSFDGSEGTLQRPLAEAPTNDVAAAAAMVATTLAAVAERHPGEQALIVMADPAATIATVLPLMAAARASFPDLRLSAGFQ